MSSQSSARLGIMLILGCTIGPTISPLLLAIIGISGPALVASMSLVIVLACASAFLTARIARVANDDQRYALLKFFLGIQFVVMAMTMAGSVFVEDKLQTGPWSHQLGFLFVLGQFAIVILIPTLMLLFKFRELLIERGLYDVRKARPTQLVSAVAIIVFAAVMILFGNKLEISGLDALRLVLAFMMAPVAVVMMHEGLVLLYGLWLETPRGTLRFPRRSD